MTDYFSLLEIDRRPWLDPDQLKEHFLRLSGSVHPDRYHGRSPEDRQQAHQRYVELNAAHQILREPKDRLRHLLELELGARPAEIQDIPAATMQTGMKVGQVCAAADRTLQERRKRLGSPLLQAELFERQHAALEQLREVQTDLRKQQEPLFEELKDLNAPWAKASAVNMSDRAHALPLVRLEEIYRSLSYLHRWQQQLQERMVELSL